MSKASEIDTSIVDFGGVCPLRNSLPIELMSQQKVQTACSPPIKMVVPPKKGRSPGNQGVRPHRNFQSWKVFTQSGRMASSASERLSFFSLIILARAMAALCPPIAWFTERGEPRGQLMQRYDTSCLTFCLPLHLSSQKVPSQELRK